MTSVQPYKTILVGLDASQAAQFAFKKAVNFAQAAAGQLVLAHVIEASAQADVPQAVIAQAQLEENHAFQTKLAAYRQQALAAGVEQVKILIMRGTARELLKKQPTDLILIGQTTQTALDRFMLGSFATAVVRNANCDVLVVKNH